VRARNIFFEQLFQFRWHQETNFTSANLHFVLFILQRIVNRSALLFSSLRRFSLFCVHSVNHSVDRLDKLFRNLPPQRRLRVSVVKKAPPRRHPSARCAPVVSLHSPVRATKSEPAGLPLHREKAVMTTWAPHASVGSLVLLILSCRSRRRRPRANQRADCSMACRATSFSSASRIHQCEHPSIT
jgi:hypothetical protein